jgi:hypothetical protein
MIMTDKPTYRERLQEMLHLDVNGNPQKEADADGGEAEGGCFGYLRGIRDHGAAIEFRFRDGNSMSFSYSLLSTWRYNPSYGLCLKFTSDVVTLVLVRGSNLDKPLKDGAIDLIHAGLQRHRILYVREMSQEEIRQVGEKGPTIESIELAEFESQNELREWLKQKAPEFVRTH